MRKWILRILVPLWLFFLVDQVLYFGLNSSAGPKWAMQLIMGRERAATYKIGGAVFSPLLRHFCARDLECVGPAGPVIRVKSICGGLDPLGMLAARGALSLERLKAVGMEVDLERPEMVKKCLSGMRMEILSLNVSDSRVTWGTDKGRIKITNLMVGGTVNTSIRRASVDLAGEYSVRGMPVLQNIIGRHGRFMVSGIKYGPKMISAEDFMVSDRLSGRFRVSLPLGHGPFSLDLYKAFIPGFKTKGTGFSNLRLYGMSGKLTGIDGKMDVNAFTADEVVMGRAGMHDVWGDLSLSATLFTGLNLDRLELRTREFKAVLTGESASPMTAARLKTQVVIWDARGAFLKKIGLYVRAESSRFYSGVGTVEIQLTPLKLKSPKIDWVVQWAPVF